jgi:hypothetical protein
MSFKVGDQIIINNQFVLVRLEGAIGIITEDMDRDGGYTVILIDHLESNRINEDIAMRIKYKQPLWVFPKSISPYFTTNREFISILPKR